MNLAEKENRQRVVRSMGLSDFNEAKEKADAFTPQFRD